MYDFFCRYTSESTAAILTGFCYGLILFAIYFCSFAPAAEFRYMAL